MERAPKNTGGIIAAQASRPAAPTAASAQRSVNQILNAMFDSEGYKKRLHDLLGERAPQFISSVIALCNADANLVAAVSQSPQTVIQAALKAAAYDLPIDNALGFAYIVPFNNSKNLKDGTFVKIPEAQFILGYKGMIQLALRSGCYARINVMDVREGELIKRDRLREDFEFDWIEEDEERENRRIIGYVGFFRLINGTEKTLYMTVEQINQHEKVNRKGAYQGKGWRENWDAMARKTVLRQLLGKWGVLSIDYKTASPAAMRASDRIAAGLPDDSTVPVDAIDVTATVEDAPISPNTQEER